MASRRRKDKDKRPRVADRPFSRVELRAFVHATEDPEAVRRAFAFAAGLDLDEEKDARVFTEEVTETSSEGHFRNPIGILELAIKRAGAVRSFWRRLLEQEAIRRGLAAQAEERLDETLSFYFRLDKQQAARGRLALAQGEDVVLVRAKLATYPKDRETGLSFLREFFTSGEPAKLL